MKLLVVLLLLSATAMAADLHPIVEMNTGYFFGGSADGKWIKAEKAAKAMKGSTSLRVFGLTEEVGKATAGKPKSVAETCPETLTASLSSNPEGGVIALSAPWNALPRKPRIADSTQQVYVDAVREFLESCRISDPKVRITRILRVDLDGDGEDEVLINATNYFTKDGGVPMDTPAYGSYSIVLLRRVVAGKVQTELIAGEVYPNDEANAPPECLRDSGRARPKRRRQARGHRRLTILRRCGDHDLRLLRRKVQSCAFCRMRSVTEDVGSSAKSKQRI